MVKIIIFVFVFTWSICLRGQEKVEVLLQQAHSTEQDYRQLTKVLAISHDDQWILSKGDGETYLVVWNLKVSKIYRQWPFMGSIISAVFKEDNENVLLNNEMVFNIHTGKIVFTLPKINQPKLTANFAWSKATHALGYEVREERGLQSFLDTLLEKYSSTKYMNKTVHCMNLDSTILWGAKQGRVYTYDLITKRLVEEISTKVGDISYLNYLDLGSILVISGDSAICIFNTHTKKSKYLQVKNTLECNLNKSGQYAAIATFDDDVNIEFWGLGNTPASLFSLKLGRRTGAVSVSFIDENNVLIVTDSLPLMTVNILQRKKSWQDNIMPEEVHFSDHGGYLISDYGYGKKRIFRLPSMEDALVKLRQSSPIIEVFSAEFSPDEKYLLLEYNHNKGDSPLFELFEISTLKKMNFSYDTIVSLFRANGSYYDSKHPLFNRNKDEIIFYAGGINKLVKYDLNSNRYQIDSLNLPIGAYSSLVYSTDKRYLVTVDFGQSPRIYNAETLEPCGGRTETELIRIPTSDGERIMRLSTVNNNIQVIHLQKTKPNYSEVTATIARNIYAFNFTKSGDSIAYVGLRQKDRSYNYIPCLFIYDISKKEIIDSVDIPSEEMYSQGHLIFDDIHKTIYLGLKAFYKYDLKKKHLEVIRLQITGQFYPINTTIDGECVAGYFKKTNSDSTFFTCVEIHKWFSTLKVHRHLNASMLDVWTNSFFFGYPEFIGDFDYYVSLNVKKPRIIEIKDFSVNLSAAALTDDHQRIVSIYGHSILIVYDETGKELHSIQPTEYGNLEFTRNRKYALANTRNLSGETPDIYEVSKGFKKVPLVYEAGKDRECRYFDNQPVYVGSRMVMSSYGKYLGVQSSIHKGFIKIYDFDTRKEIFFFSEDYLTNKDSLNPILNSLPGLLFSDDESTVLSTSYSNFLLKINPLTKSVQKLIHAKDDDASNWRFYISSTGRWVAAFVSDKHNLLTNLLTDKLESHNDFGRLVVWDNNGNFKELKIQMEQSDLNVAEINIDEIQNIITLRKSDGLHFYSLNDLKLINSIIDPDIFNFEIDSSGILTIQSSLYGSRQYQMPAFRPITIRPANKVQFEFDGQFQSIICDTVQIAKFIFDNTNKEVLFFAPDNYYALKKQSKDAIAFRINNNLFDCSTLDEIYNRPDIIFSRLKEVFNFSPELIECYRSAYIKRNKLDLEKIIGLNDSTKPQINISLLGKTVVTTLKQYPIRLLIQNTDNRKLLYNVAVNGVTIFGKKGKIVIPNTTSIDVMLPLLPGINNVKATLTDQTGIVFLPSIIQLDMTDSSYAHSKVYFVGIGISNYKHLPHLPFASKDIRDISALFRDRYSQNVIIDTLLDEHVTRSEIVDLKNKLLESNIEDKVIIYYSGHGILNKDFYLSTYNTISGGLDTGSITISEIYDLLDSIPARNRLILLDACHSGNVYQFFDGKTVIEDETDDKITLEEVMENVFLDCENNYGINVIAASRGNGVAFADKESSNSQFASAVKYAIQTNLEGRFDNQKITIKDFTKFVIKRVIQTSNNTQIPNNRIENLELDWMF